MSQTKMTVVRYTRLIATYNKTGRFNGIVWECHMECEHVINHPAKIGGILKGTGGCVTVDRVPFTTANRPMKLKCQACRFLAQQNERTVG